MVPKHLSAESARWVQTILADAGEEITQTEGLLLVKAAEAFDRAETARRRIERDGLVVLDRFGQPKPHPAVAIERDSRAAFARIVGQLGLDTRDTPSGSYRGQNGRIYAGRA